MRGAHLLISLAGLLIGFLLILVGFFLFTAAYVPQATQVVQSLFLHHLEGLSYCGLLLLFLGVSFLSLFFWLNRRQYLLLKMGDVSVDERVIAQCAHQSLQVFFPNQPVECDVILNQRGNIEIIANIPTLPEAHEEQALRAIEKKLATLLQKQFQYDQPFLLNVSFFDNQK